MCVDSNSLATPTFVYETGAACLIFKREAGAIMIRHVHTSESYRVREMKRTMYC